MPIELEKRIVVFNICCEVPFIPSDKSNEQALKMLCRVVQEGLHINVIAGTVVTMTEEQARKNFEKADTDEKTEIQAAVEEAKEHLKS